MLLFIMHTCKLRNPTCILGFNVDVICSFVPSINHTLEEVLQLGEVEAGLGLLTPADQHQLITVTMTNKREGEVYNYNMIVPLNNSTAEHTIFTNTVAIYRHNNQQLVSPIVIINFLTN